MVAMQAKGMNDRAELCLDFISPRSRGKNKQDSAAKAKLEVSRRAVPAGPGGGID